MVILIRSSRRKEAHSCSVRRDQSLLTSAATRHRAAGGFFNIELVVAIAILGVVMLPLGGAWYHETRMLRTYYRDAVAMEILDGEAEVLAAGGWRNFAEGRHELKPTANAAKNLPPGHFILTREAQRVRLEWRPERGRKMAREVKLP